MGTITENNKKRHDHTDTIPRCNNCAGFLPETPGHNRDLCPNCSAPNTWYIKE